VDERTTSVAATAAAADGRCSSSNTSSLTRPTTYCATTTSGRPGGVRARAFSSPRSRSSRSLFRGRSFVVVPVRAGHGTRQSRLTSASVSARSVFFPPPPPPQFYSVSVQRTKNTRLLRSAAVLSLVGRHSRGPSRTDIFVAICPTDVVSAPVVFIIYLQFVFFSNLLSKRYIVVARVCRPNRNRNRPFNSIVRFSIRSRDEM